MKIKKLIYQCKPPCPGCPYKLGKIRTVVNPCLQCRLNGYQNYELFREQLSRKDLDDKEGEGLV